MARPKGGKNKRWSTEEKLRIVRRYFDERIGQGTLAKEENISAGQLYNWIKRYADPIDMQDGGDKPFRRAMFAASWIMTKGKKHNGA